MNGRRSLVVSLGVSSLDRRPRPVDSGASVCLSLGLDRRNAPPVRTKAVQNGRWTGCSCCPPRTNSAGRGVVNVTGRRPFASVRRRHGGGAAADEEGQAAPGHLHQVAVSDGGRDRRRRTRTSEVHSRPSSRPTHGSREPGSVRLVQDDHGRRNFFRGICGNRSVV